MEIKKLKLKNFRNFKNCEIEFSCDKEKNFTIILGQNTFGKTTLVKSFIWCLYRINLFNDKILLNNDVANSLRTGNSETASVEIELNHNNFSYKIITKQEFCLSNSGKVTEFDVAKTSIIKIDENANCIPIPGNKVNEEIENILRSDLKEYFFFDGESNSIETVASKKNLTNAVSNILGLSKIESLKDYFDPKKSESVVSYLERELIKNDTDDLDDLDVEKEKLLNEKENLYSKKIELEKEINKLEEQRQKIENILDANRDVETYQRDKMQCEKAINKNAQNREISLNSLIGTINSGDAFLKMLFAFSFVKFNFNDLKEKSSFQSDNSYIGITEDAVNQLIKDGKCICGAEIKCDNDAYKHLIMAKEHMEPHDYGKYIGDFISSEKSNVYNGECIQRNIEDLANNVINSIQEIDENRKSLKNIKQLLEGRPDVGEYQKEISNIDRQIGSLMQNLSQIVNTYLPSNEDKLNSINKKIEKATANNDKNSFTKDCLFYAKYIFKLASERMIKSKDLIKEKLQDEVSAIFKTMYHGNRGIRIDDNFKADTYVQNYGKDLKIDASQGLKTVVNYSFVAGLMNLAKKQILNDDKDDDTADLEENSQVYPLVMDAPFSNTDNIHIKNICDALSKYCDQIIMFIMEKDFNYAKESIADKIGKKYQICQISETESEIEEVL